MNALTRIANFSRPVGLAALLAATGLMSTLSAQGNEQSGGATAAREGAVEIYDEYGDLARVLQAKGFPVVTVSPYGPTVIITDEDGTRLVDRRGNAKSSLIAKVGQSQYVALAGDCLIIYDDDRARVFDHSGKQLGGDIGNNGKAPKLIVRDGLIIAAHDTGVLIRHKDGTPDDSFGTNGMPDVIFDGKRITVIDGGIVHVLDRDGNRVGGFVPTPTTVSWNIVQINDTRYYQHSDDQVQMWGDDGLAKGSPYPRNQIARQGVVVAGDRVIIIDDHLIRVTDPDGVQIGGMTTSGSWRAQVTTTEDRIIVTDDKSTRTFANSNMLKLFEVGTTGLDRQQVTADGDRIIIVDQTQTQIFDSNGVRQGTAIPRTGTETQRVHINGDRVGIVDTDKVRIFDRNGKQVSQDIPYVDDLEHGLQMFANAITITDFDWVRILDRDGTQQGNSIRVSDGVQHNQAGGDRVLVTHDNFFRVFATNGNQVGQTHAVGFDPEINAINFEGGWMNGIGLECGSAKQYGLGNPAIGQELTYQVSNAPAGAMAQLNMGFSRDNWGPFVLPFPLDGFGAPGCTVYNDAVAAFGAVVGGNGLAELKLDVPNDLSLIGFTLYSQWLVLVPGANSLGVVLSDGMETRIGGGF